MSKSLEEIRRRYAATVAPEAPTDESKSDPEWSVEEEMMARIRRRLCPIDNTILKQYATVGGYGCPRCRFQIFPADSEQMSLERALQQLIGIAPEQLRPEVPSPVPQSVPSTPAPASPPVDMSKLRASGAPATRGRWFKDKDVEGDPDALLQFGKHSGQFISAMVQDRDGRSYLEWMLAGDFSPDLKDIVKIQMTKRRLR